MVHIPTIVMWVLSTVTFLYGDYWSRDVSPAWSQHLLGASAGHRVRLQDPAVPPMANITTSTMTTWVTVMAPHSSASSTAMAASTLQSAISYWYPTPSTEIGTNSSTFQRSATPDATVIAFALALALCVSLAILGRQMSLPRATDMQLDCTIMAAHISQQNLCMEEMGQFHATALARLHRQLQVSEDQNTELRGKAAEHDRTTLALRQAQSAVELLQLEVEAARNEALAAGWQAEERAALTIDGLRTQQRVHTRELADAERTIQARDSHITELEAAASEVSRAAVQEDSAEVRSLRDTVAALEADLVAAGETTWDATDKAKRSDDTLRAEIGTLNAALEEQKRRVVAAAEMGVSRADEHTRVLQARDDAIASLKAELAAANMKVALADVPSFACEPAGAREEDMRRRLAAAAAALEPERQVRGQLADSVHVPPPPVAAGVAPVVRVRRPRTVVGPFGPMRPVGKKVVPGSGEGSSGGAPRGPRPEPEA